MVNYHASVLSLVVALAPACAWPCPLAAQRAEGESSMVQHVDARDRRQDVRGATVVDNPTASAFKALLPLRSACRSSMATRRC